MRAEIADALKFGPNVLVHTDRIIRRLDAAHQFVLEQQRWTFGELEVLLPTFADDAIVCNVTNGSPLVTVTTPAAVLGQWAGQTFENATGQRFTIGAVTGTSIKLTEPYTEATAVGLAGFVRFFSYLAPPFTVDVLDVFDRQNERGTVRYLARAEEAELLGGGDQTGTPEVYLFSNTVRLDQPLNIYGTPAVSVPWAAATAVFAGPALDTNTDYRYFFVLQSGLNIGARSTVLTRNTGAGPNVAISLTGLPVFAAGTGINKLIYREDPKHAPGVFRQIATVDEVTATYLDANGTATGERWIDLGPQPSIAFFPRPNADTEYHVRFQARPFRLQTDTDVPQLPPEYHRILVHIVTSEVAAESEGKELALFHERKWREMMKFMKRRYLAKTGTPKQRRLWSDSTRLVARASITFIP